MTASTRWVGALVLIIASLGAVATRAVAAPAYVGRVAGTQATPLFPTSSVTLTASRPVAGGDALLIALKLSTSLFGGIGATDAAGNTYQVDIDQADGLGLSRTIVISATNVRALSAGASITVNFPMSGAYMISVDEFSGLAARDVIASASGNGSTFNSGVTPSTSQPIELLYGAVGNESGSAPGWSAGWTGLPTLTLGGDNLGAAYGVTSSAGAYAASGSTSGTWMAGIATYTATAADNPPSARLTVAQLASPALTVRADGSGSTDGDATPIASYRFDFGDGSTAVTTTAPTATAQHTYAASGTYTVMLIATDTGGNASSPATASVNVTGNRAPTLSQPANMTVAQGATADQAITGSDPDGDALTFSKVSGPAFMTVTTTSATAGNVHVAPGSSEPAGTSSATVRASDGSLSNDKTLTITVNNVNRAPTLSQPANMTVNEGATADQTLNATDPDGNALTFSLASGPTYASVTTTAPGTGTATGNLHLAPGFSNAGTAAATVRVSDGSLADQKSLTITVNNVNRAPTLNQPANMSVAQGATADQAITGSDPDGSALTFSKVSGPAFMTVATTNATTGNIHLAPGTSDPVGTSAATVRASDGSLTNDKTLTITVNTAGNRAPTLSQPANMTVNEGATADQTLNATDPDGNALTFSLASGPTYASVTTTAPGTGTATGNLHLAPGFSNAGTAAATVRVSDGSLADQKSLTITVNNVNRAPTLNQPANMSVAQGATADQAITGSDPDGTALTFSKVSGPAFMTVTTTSATAGNVHVAPGSSEPAGTSSATVRASDGSLTNDKTLTITVNTAGNRAPTLSQPANMTVNEGATADQTLNATDPDGNALTFSLASGPTYASVTTTTPGAGTATGNLHLAPGFSNAGTAAATVRVSDGSLTNQKSMTITVNNVNRAPTLNQPANMTVAQGATADQAITGSDPDGDALTFSKVSGPAFMTVTTTNATTGNIHLAPGTSDPVGISAATVRASDGSLTNDKTLTITVTNAASTGAQVAVYVGYYDTHHPGYPKPKPNPWRGSPNVVFVGNPDGGTTDGWDTSVLRVDNLSGSSITVRATVDIGTHNYALWSPQTVPPGWALILAQTALYNFDGSDTNPAGCYGCNPNLCTTMISHTIPVVNLTVNGATTTYPDSGQVLNTKGVDAAGCPATGTRNDESHAWKQISPTGVQQRAGRGATARAFDAHEAMGLPVPNPTLGDLTVRLSNPVRGAVRAGIYDVAGRLVLPCVDGVLEAGDYNMQINLRGKPAGLYWVVLTTREGTTRRKFVYVR